VEGIDPDSSSIRDRMLVILRERQDQLQKATNYSEAKRRQKTDVGIYEDIPEYQDWKQRKARELVFPRRNLAKDIPVRRRDVLPSNRS